MPSNTILKVKDLTKKYYKTKDHIVHALRSVDFQLQKGEFIVIMGSSGSGKSTLLQLLGGLDIPSSGEIYLRGEKTKNFNEELATKYRRENIGFVFQFFNLLDALTVEENVALPLVLKGESAKDIKTKTNEILHVVGLSSRQTHRPTELSGGQQQRVALARALVTNPAILLADEPTGNLDSKTSSEILHLIDDTRRKLNQSVVLVTHDPKVATFGDRILFFHDGEIVDQMVTNKNHSQEENTRDIMNKLHDVLKDEQV